jgi:hypothetical protein
MEQSVSYKLLMQLPVFMWLTNVNLTWQYAAEQIYSHSYPSFPKFIIENSEV